MTNTFDRPDTFFGVCEALGQDLGIHSNWLRAALGVAVLWQPLWAIAAYVAAGVFIVALRLLVPDPRPAPALVVDTANDEAPVELAKAA